MFDKMTTIFDKINDTCDKMNNIADKFNKINITPSKSNSISSNSKECYVSMTLRTSLPPFSGTFLSEYTLQTMSNSWILRLRIFVNFLFWSSETGFSRGFS